MAAETSQITFSPDHLALGKSGVILWLLQTFGPGLVMVEIAEDSFLGRFGSPIFKPQGFGVWQVAVALLASFLVFQIGSLLF